MATFYYQNEYKHSHNKTYHASHQTFATPQEAFKRAERIKRASPDTLIRIIEIRQRVLKEY